jgi:hypothetical protein
MARKRKSEQKNFWGAVILDWFHHLQDNDLTSSDYKILFYICTKMKSEDNIAYIKQKQIAENLLMDKGNVSKCIKKLSRKQFIAKCTNGYMMNPHLFYIGKVTRDSREQLQEEYDEYVIKSGLKPKFELNEDDRRLDLNN